MSVSKKLKMSSSNVLFCPQAKKIQFTVTESENFDFGEKKKKKENGLGW